MTIKQIIRSELSGWQPLEIAYLAVLTLTAFGVSIYMGDTPMNIACATIGVASVVLAGKGKLLYFPLYLVYSILYACIAWSGSYYGQSLLYMAFLAPMCIYGCIGWFKNLNGESHEINKRRLTTRQRIFGVVTIAVITAAMSIILSRFGDMQPFKDSLTTVLIIYAFLLGLFRYVENWWIWIVSNIVNTTLWVINLQANDSYAPVVMFSIFLVNSVVAMIKWQKSLKNQ